MPNWASGYVEVKGKPENIEKFCKLFIFEEEEGKKSKSQEKYFARSFIYHTWKGFKRDILGKNQAEFPVDFAWSGYSCLIEGYPTTTKKRQPEEFGNCVTLEWACKKYNVEVNIETEEGNECFTEEITYTKKDGLKDLSEIMPTHTCQKCGYEQTISKNYDLDDTECYECDEIGFWGQDDELQKIVKEKFKK